MESTESSKFYTQGGDLPIVQFKQDIVEIIKDNWFSIITGDTGSGKSTQLPQYVYDSIEIYKAIHGLELERSKLLAQFKENRLSIVVTQPRRMAAIAMAKRVCFERKIPFAEEISYSIRFEDKCSEKTKLRYVTDGILVRECLFDPLLQKYNVVILDEAHERSIHTDILFALVKQAVIKRNGNLRLIITSATLNTEQFSKYFNSCPILKVTGRCYPVDILYNSCSANKRIEEAVRAAIRMHLHEGPGDILAFLPGSEDCEAACRLCIKTLQELVEKGKSVPGMVIYPLYGSQSSEDQARVFEKPPSETRKLVFATNIAETSLTIDGVGFVVDCGYVKQKCYNPRTGMDALIIVPISKVQAIQRAGRAGRTQAGKCYRMYSESFYKEQMIESTIPEILRVNLANSILTLKAMGIHDVIKFEFMEPPDRDQILNALKQLYLLSAIDEDGKINDFGLEMSKFPLEPSYSKSLIASMVMGCDEEMLTSVSLLSSEMIWTKVSKQDEDKYEDFLSTQRKLMREEGDHATLISIYERWRKRGHFSEGWCNDNYLNSRALRQTQNIRNQLADLFSKINLKLCKNYVKQDETYQLFLKKKEDKKGLKPFEAFRMALNMGFYFNSARRVANSDCDYLLLGEGNIVNLDPQSVFSLMNKYPDYLIFTELGGTTIVRGIMRIVSEVEQDWVKPYLQKIKNVNLQKLACLHSVVEVDLNSKRKNEVDLEAEFEKKKKDKVEEAKLRFLERKKVKK